MKLQIEYETICVDCAQKGYSFGYTFKSIIFNGIYMMDMPTRYLNGPCIAFKYKKVPILIRSLENSHSNINSENKPKFSMINAKKDINGVISRFTYQFFPERDKKLKQVSEESNFDEDKGENGKNGKNGLNRTNNTNKTNENKIFEFVDIYRYPKKPYILMFYSFLNSTQSMLENINFYQFYDFDINGQDKFDTDASEYDSENNIIFQYDFEEGLKKSKIAGIGSNSKNFPNFFESNNSKDILISFDRLNLRNFIKLGPDDLSLALQWKIPKLDSGEFKIFPVFMVFGNGIKDFNKNINKARDHLEKLKNSVYKNINQKHRQIIDPKLEKLSFSMQKWCK